MPIVKRFETVQEETSDEVQGIEARAKDHRGVFDPKENPFAGSEWDFVKTEDGEPSADALASLMLRFGSIACMDGETPDPQEMRVQTLLTQVRVSRNNFRTETEYRNRIMSPLSAIRAWCVVECKYGSIKDVSTCRSLECPLWPFRLGTNGMRGKQ